MAEAPAGRCASPLISAAWVVEPTGVHDGSLAADSSHAHARGDAVLVVSWGADVRVLWWGAAAAAAAGEAGVQCFAQQPCSMDALHLGQQHQGPPRALATGPDGTLLATFDAPLGLSLGASSFGTDLTPSEPARALNGVAERQAGGGGDGGGGGGGAVVDLRGKHPGPECGPGSLAAAAKECDVGANGRSVSGREGGGLLGALLDGSALRGIGGAAGGIGAVCGGLVSVVGEPSDDAQPGGSGSASLGGGGDLKPDAAPLLRAMGALGLGQPKAVPTAFMLAGGGGGGGGRGGGAGAACLVQVRLLPLGGDGDGGREGGEGAPAHASTLLLLPRPDLLACLGDLIAVGSSVGAAGVQLFRCCASAPPTLRPTADGGTCTGTGACAASASTGAAATGRQLPLRLVPLAAAALGTPSLDASALRLRGLRLAWCEGTTAVSTSASASPSTTCSGGHPAEGHASTQAPTTRGGGQRVRLVALLGGCDRAGGPQLPSFMSRARGNGGGGGTPLSPLVLCTYQPAWLACAAMARPAVSARALADAGAVSGHVGGDAAGGDAAGVHALADAFAGMEARLMERLARMEVDARVAQRELSDRLSRMEDMLVAVLGLAGGPMWLEGGER
ncbi:hypothetical protein FOA52_014595 [Chlamydomonas sp. UWO 241]|nr:hypothetical protein FOA52_014595 [Chlamydomonas sp. UWO 241]